MKKLFLFVLASVFSLNLLAQTAEDTYTKVGDSVPVFSFEIEKGKLVNIRDFKGKLILINLFATWCPPCNAELPEIQSKIWDKHKDNPNFAFFVFGREEGWEKLLPYKEKKGFTFPILPDLKKDVFSKFAKQYIPRNILIDQNGKIIYQSLGFEEKEFNNLIKLIDNQLNSAKTK